jgi:L,D-peptidoglycan transpeptidase YkuD (ErfK/YbiS/YcfS/YnhG family)
MELIVRNAGHGHYELSAAAHGGAPLSMRCAIGRSGMVRNKAEGDGGTPVGAWPLRGVFFRADRIPKPKTKLPLREISPADGWCDAPKDRNYNRLVKLPYPASAEDMWRSDEIYDLVVELGYNDDPIVPGKGSAIFLHVARPKYSPTAGCVAVALGELRTLLALVEPGSHIVIDDQM